MPSLFAEPRRIIDVDEAVELLTAVMPDLDTSELRERLGSKRGFVWLKREITPKQQQEVHRLGIPGIGFLNENKRVYPNGREVSHLIGHVNVDNQGIAGIEKWLDTRGLADLHRAGFASDRQQEPVALAVDLRVQHALRDELDRRAPRSSRPRHRPASFSTCAPARSSPWCRTRTTTRTIRSEALDPNRINRLTTGVYRNGLDLQGADRGDGARFRQGQRSIRPSTRACRCATASSTSTTTTRSGAF